MIIIKTIVINNSDKDTLPRQGALGRPDRVDHGEGQPGHALPPRGAQAPDVVWHDIIRYTII